MAIRITRNENGNCINFVGSSQAAYWNACLSGEVNETDTTRVNVVNDIRTTDSSNPVYEFFGVPYTEFQDKDGNSFANAQAAADYITAQANVASGTVIQFGATDTVNFSRDLTNTSILSSTGDSFGVNSIKAIGTADGLITITENVSSGGTNLMEGIRPNYVTIEGQTQAQTQVAVVNSLNALFTVTPVGAAADDVFASFTYSTGDAAMVTFGDVTDSADVATKGTNTGSDLNDGIYSTARPISANGEYFEFDNTGRDEKRKFVIGLKLTSEITSASVLESNTSVGEDMALAVRLKANSTYEHSPYGAVIENGFYSRPQKSNRYRAGMDANGRLFISHFDEDDDAWQVIVRSAFITANEEYSLVLFLNQEGANTTSNVTSYQINEGSVTLNYRYIESPDGEFYYPLFASTEEAAYADELAGGSGTYHSHTFVDELPSSNVWYMPSTGGTHAGASAPSNTASITYSAISTGVDSNYAPAAFDVADLTINENTVINYQVAPVGASYTVTASGMPAGVTLSGTNLVGTTPEVTGTTVTNPSDAFTITTTRTNSFGSVSDTFVLTVTNTTADNTAIAGFTHIAGSTDLVDSDTLADGSAVTLDNTVDNGNRLKITDAWVTANVLPNLTADSDKIFIGFSPTPTTGWSGITVGDFNCGFRFQYQSATSVKITPMLGGTQMGTDIIHGISGNMGYDFYLSNKDGVCEANYHASSTDKSTEPTAADGGTWDYTATQDTSVTEAKTVVIGVTSTTADISLTGISEHTLPATATNLTNWTKALDFSGGNEYALKVSNWSGANPLLMDGISQVLAGPSTAGNTTNVSNARPWATTIVFKYDGNNSNQHIWNSGEGASSTNDNIYLRLDASGYLYFGWGRTGALNECRFLYLGTSTNTNHWHGIYIAHNGTRLSGSNATAANLANAFDIRWMTSNDNPAFTNDYGNRSTAANWTAGSTGGRMDRQFDGDLTIGGRGGNRNFHGKVASMVVTTLRLGVAMPTDAEIKLMITDPKKWEDDYRVGQTVRRSQGATDVTYSSSSVFNGHGGTQIWLMGDGHLDSYSNGIRNQVYHADQNYGKLQLNSMVSNDIETVSIPGLS